MPYKSIRELPEGVRNSLPESAQKLYMNAYNFAYRTHPNWDESRRSQYAWGAVKRRYHKDGDTWKKSEMSLASIEEDDFSILDGNDLLETVAFVFKSVEDNIRSDKI